MSQNGLIIVKKDSKKVHYHGEGQQSASLSVGISIAYSLYTKRPGSYSKVFTDPKEFEDDFFDCCDDEDPWGDTRTTVDLSKQVVEFGWAEFSYAMEEEDIETAKAWFEKLLPYCVKKVSEDIQTQVQELEDIHDIEEEELDCVTFRIPFADLTAFKDLAYSWPREEDDE